MPTTAAMPPSAHVVRSGAPAPPEGARRPVRRAPSGGAGAPDLTTWALGGMAAVVGIGALLWCGAALAALVTGRDVPQGGLVPALRAVGSWGDPASAWPSPAQIPGPVAYWATTAVVVLVASAAGVGAGARWLRRDSGASASAARQSMPGLASAHEVLGVAGERAILRRAAVVRPSTIGTKPAPDAVGYRLGTIGRRSIWCSVEDSALLVGPPRMGKGLHVVIPWHARSLRGPVAVFDPQRLAGLPGGLAWSPIRGCELPRTALVRARGLAAGVGFGRTVSDGDFWSGQTETALRCLLHAAALDGRTSRDLYRWSLNPVLASDAIAILSRESSAATGWADALDAAVHADPRTRDSIWLGVRQSLAALLSRDRIASVDPAPDAGFDPTTFLRDSGPLYLLASAVASGSSAPLVAAFVEDVTETARHLAARSAGARLDPPLLLALDEIANLTPLPSLPSLMAEGGGTGITTLAVLQSLAQARGRWGEHAADAIWDAATVKLVLGGLAKYRDLEDVARLLGEIDEVTHTTNRSRRGDASTSTSLRTMPVMPPSVLRHRCRTAGFA